MTDQTPDGEGATPTPPPSRVVRDTAERTRQVRWERRWAATILELRGRVEELEGRPVLPENLAEVVAGLREELDRLQEQAARVPDAFHWDDMVDPDARGRREFELRAWWRGVVEVWCPREADAVLPCWYDHLPARRVVTECWLAWLGAHRVRGRKHSDPATWARVNLPQMVAGVGAEFPSGFCDQHPRED